MTERVDCVVAGAGVVGLAVARAFALRGREVLILESEAAFGTGTSARNSEVIHAGIYYPAGSLKARLCVQGREQLYDYCASHGVPHSRVGKLIVATSNAQLDTLKATQQRAAANGVHDLQWLSPEQACVLEPNLMCAGALLSPSTGIVDSHALMLSLLGGVEEQGGFLVPNTALTLVNKGQDALFLEASDGTQLHTKLLINAAGLTAPDLAQRFLLLDKKWIPEPRYAKGSYFALGCRAPFSRLVYPVPEQGGLGVHLTLDMAGQARFGPDVQWVDHANDLSVDERRAEAFYAEVRKYWPELPDHALHSAYAGIRPKVAFDGQLCEDFVIQGPAQHGVQGLVNLFGIESPGLTSALAIGEYVVSLTDGE